MVIPNFGYYYDIEVCFILIFIIITTNIIFKKENFKVGFH